MNNLLALSILQIIEKGENFGFLTIRNEIKTYESLWNVTDVEYRDTMTALQVNECLLPAGRDAYRLNPNKRCIDKYKELIENQQKENDLDTKTKKLMALNLELQNEIHDLKVKLAEAQLEDIPKNAEDRKTISIWTVGIAAVAIIEFFLLIFGASLKP